MVDSGALICYNGNAKGVELFTDLTLAAYQLVSEFMKINNLSEKVESTPSPEFLAIIWLVTARTATFEQGDYN